MHDLQATAIAPTMRFAQPSHPSIGGIVRHAFSIGYLTIDAENQLRQLLRQKYDRADLIAFMQLQVAAMEGNVRQESRDRQLTHRQKS